MRSGSADLGDPRHLTSVGMRRMRQRETGMRARGFGSALRVAAPAVVMSSFGSLGWRVDGRGARLVALRLSAAAAVAAAVAASVGAMPLVQTRGGADSGSAASTAGAPSGAPVSGEAQGAAKIGRAHV